MGDDNAGGKDVSGSKNAGRKLSFTRLSDHFNVAARAGLAYGVQTAIFLSQTPPVTARELLTNFALIACIFTALRFRYVREIPMWLSTLVVIPLIARKRSAAPESIQSITDEFTKKAGYNYQIKTYIYEKGISKNAFTVGDRVYVGKALADSLSHDELRFALGHELAHSRTQDLSLQYLLWPPFINSLIGAIGGVSALLAGEAGLATAAIGYGYFKLQDALWSTNSQKLEFRADRNALQLTGDVEAAKSALKKLHVMRGVDPEAEMAKNPRSSWFSSHPCLKERLDNLEKEHALMTAGPKPAP